MGTLKNPPQAMRSFQVELDGLRRELLSTLLWAMVGTGWIWLAYIAISQRAFQSGDRGILALFGSAYLAHKLRRKHPLKARWILVAGMILTEAFFVTSHSLPVAIAFGTPIILAANALLGTGGMLGATLLLCGVNLLFSSLSGRYSPTFIPYMLLLYALVSLAAWAVAHPLQTSIDWALAGWARSQQLLTEARNRRMELYRALKALEEATYRIEHMNEELLTAQKEAELARALKARLVATVSHELRGPLHLILGFSKLMALTPEVYGEPLPRAYRADIHAIYRNTQHLAALVDDILDLSQIEAERLPLVKDQIDLEKDVIKKAIEIVRPLVERKGLSIRQELAGNLPWILADQVRLRQVLLNLLHNAIRFTEAGHITVRTTLLEDQILVSVEDTGPGIAPEDMPKLFKAFHQVHPDRNQEGSGLGLAISKHLVELHGGQIWAESEPGMGTKLHFTLPLPGRQRSLSPIVKVERRDRQCPTPVCLVVHDDPFVVRTLARYIEDFRIVGVPSGRELLTFIKDLYPRAIITSNEQAETIKTQLAKSDFDIPIISCRMPRLGEQCRLNGILSYLVKPISPQVLTSIVHQVERDGETTILLVDDEPDAVRLLERMLISLPRPYNIYKAYDGLQALAMMRQLVPDVVFLDLVMPEVDGYQVLQQMRQEEQLCEIPVVIVSARDWVEDGIFLRMPFSLYRRQPLDIAKGAKCLHALLSTVNPQYLGAAPAPH